MTKIETYQFSYQPTQHFTKYGGKLQSSDRMLPLRVKLRIELEKQRNVVGNS